MNMSKLHIIFSMTKIPEAFMRVIDPKSIIIGVLGTLLIFSTLGFRAKTDELGHLVVRSLTIEDDRGVIMGYLGNGYMQT